MERGGKNASSLCFKSVVMGENFFCFQIPPIPVLKEGVTLWFLESVNGDIVLCENTIISACVVSEMAPSGDVKSTVKYYTKGHMYRDVHDYEIGVKYFLSKYDLSNALIKSKEDSKSL